MSEAHPCLEPEQESEPGPEGSQSQLSLFPMPVPPVAAGVSAEPARLPGQPLPPGFPRAANCYFCGPPSSRICGIAFPASAVAVLPTPCRLGGLWAQEGRELEQDTGFQVPIMGWGAAAGQGGCGREDHWSPETGRGLGSVQTHGLERGLLAGSGLYCPEGHGSVGRAEHHRIWDSRSNFAVQSPGHAVGGGEAPGPCPPWAAGARGKRSQ